MPASVAPSPTAKMKRGRGWLLPVKEASAATKPAIIAATASVAGSTVVMRPAQSAAAHRPSAARF
jgi:hypothetical protein